VSRPSVGPDAFCTENVAIVQEKGGRRGMNDALLGTQSTVADDG
jgi:hypothetical protein